ENFRPYLWQKQLHLYEVPFYYIEYALAQLGAIAVWRNFRQDPAAALAGYQRALALGYTRPIGELVVARHETITWQPVEQLSETERGTGGYGSTGNKKNDLDMAVASPLLIARLSTSSSCAMGRRAGSLLLFKASSQLVTWPWPALASLVKPALAQQRLQGLARRTPLLPFDLPELPGEQPPVLVPPFDDAYVIAGQGTVGLEILEDLPAVELVLAPVGGGGLLGGVAAALKLLKPSVKIIGVEPELAADAQASFRQGRVVEWAAADTNRTLADGVRTLALSELTLAHLRQYADDVVTVSEAELRAAARRLLLEARLVVEPTAALPLAALLRHRDSLPPSQHTRLVEDIARVCGEPVEEVAFIIGRFGAEVEKSLVKIAESVGAKGTIYYQDEPL
nr:hypothetical protein [Tanacetum cinerariifolium]